MSTEKPLYKSVNIIINRRGEGPDRVRITQGWILPTTIAKFLIERDSIVNQIGNIRKIAREFFDISYKHANYSFRQKV